MCFSLKGDANSWRKTQIGLTQNQVWFCLKPSMVSKKETSFLNRQPMKLVSITNSMSQSCDFTNKILMHDKKKSPAGKTEDLWQAN